MRLYYVTYNPYGNVTYNANGVQANRLYGYQSRAYRDAVVDANDAIFSAVLADDPIVRRCKREAKAHGFDIENWLSPDGWPYHDR